MLQHNNATMSERPDEWIVSDSRQPTAQHRHDDAPLVQAESTIIMLRPRLPVSRDGSATSYKRTFLCECGDAYA